MKVHIIREHASKHGGRLGRHVEHDPASRAFNVVTSPKVKLRSLRWERHCDPFNQGKVGSCTGNAGAGLAMTDPIWRPGRELTEDDAVRIYMAATRVDKIPGHYLPDDTGSSGLAVAKVLHRLGIVGAYSHAFGLLAMQTALQSGPVMIGINWYAAFDKPKGRNAELVIGGDVRGGHEVEINEIDMERRLFRGPNSWGTDWADEGYFTIGFATMERLLDEDGDCTRAHLPPVTLLRRRRPPAPSFRKAA